jgi:cell division septal protein FtsQ
VSLPGRARGVSGRRRKHGRRLPARSARADRKAPAVRHRPRRRLRAAIPLRFRWGRPGRRAGLAAFAALLALGAALGARYGVEWLAARPFLAVREVRVEGARTADADELQALSGVTPGTPWLTLDTHGVAFRLESHPSVRRARVRRPWPGRVVLDVTECQPLAVIRVDERPYGLCDDLRVVPLPEGDADLPVIRDFASGRGADPEELERGLEYVRVLRKLGITQHVRLDLRRDDCDVIALPERGFEAEVQERLPAGAAARDVAAFLERLDEEGGGRGTLRLISEGTAVWKASA